MDLSFPLPTDLAARLLAAAVLRTLGGKGSGNFDHAGRPGEKGGSGEGGSSDMSVTSEVFVP